MMTTRIMHAVAVVALSGAAVATLSACVPNQQPLIFASRTTLGVTIDAQAATAGGIGLTLGYDQEDLSVVPISVLTKEGQALHPIRGCYSAVRGPGEASCGALDSQSQMLAVQPSVTTKALNGGGEGNQPGKQAMHDALSVYSSFDATVDGAGADASANLGLGKLFATGVAAQQLTEGQNYYLQSKGKAEYAAAVSVCLTALKAAAGGTLTADQMKVCSGEPAAVAATQPATR